MGKNCASPCYRLGLASPQDTGGTSPVRCDSIRADSNCADNTRRDSNRTVANFGNWKLPIVDHTPAVPKQNERAKTDKANRERQTKVSGA